MDVVREIAQNMWRYFTLLTVWDVLDILIVTLAIFKFIQVMRKSNALRVLQGIVLLLAVMLLAELIGLRIINYVLVNAMQIGLFALVVVFQPELRKMLEQMGGSSRLRSLLGRAKVGNMEHVLVQTVNACSALSWRREGALIVFERTVMLDDIVKTGTVIDAEVTAELLKNIFYPKAPLHDGAVVIRDGRVAGAGCVLPLTDKQDLSRDLGMRHRAAIGMSERADALVVIVSEETGSISVADGGSIKRHLAPETLDLLLRKELLPDTGEDDKRGVSRWVRKVKGTRK
ncbi:MAG: diadenylate cyclase CdaA [Oscillospiraceae bacterium]|nr:diadenylate cyclase CdaA [Oscillospiraceae bacterium]